MLDTEAMIGEVRSIDARQCRGWARLPAHPNYAPTLHLVVDDKVYASCIAERTWQDENERSASEEGWFVLDVPEELRDRTRDLQVLVGETGTFLGGSPSGRDGISDRSSLPSPPATVATDRDGMALGLELADLVDLLYLDILKRPADATGLAHVLSGLARGELSLQGIRKALLDSEEYGRLRLKASDAPGRVFCNPLLIRSSSRRRRFETHVHAFCRATMPMPERLLRFFPGLLVRPETFQRIEAATARGLPAREIFCRALSALSDRPALILPDLPEPASRVYEDSTESAAGEITVPAASPLFALGWHRVEDPLRDPFRWMSQIGIILNPCPQRTVERVEVTVGSWYGALAPAMAVASERRRLGFERRQVEDGSTLLRIVGDEGGEQLDHVVLVGGDALCPYRHTGLPDPRLLCCTVTKAVFIYAGEAA